MSYNPIGIVPWSSGSGWQCVWLHSRRSSSVHSYSASAHLISFVLLKIPGGASRLRRDTFSSANSAKELDISIKYLQYKTVPTGWGGHLFRRFCKLLSESSPGSWAVLQLPCSPSKGNFWKTYYITFGTSGRPTQ